MDHNQDFSEMPLPDEFDRLLAQATAEPHQSVENLTMADANRSQSYPPLSTDSGPDASLAGASFLPGRRRTPRSSTMEPGLYAMQYPQLQTISEEGFGLAYPGYPFQHQPPMMPAQAYPFQPPMMPAPEAPQGRRRQTTSSDSSQAYATTSNAAPAQWHGPPQTTMEAGYGSTMILPATHTESPAASSPAPRVAAKTVKHKRGYQACDQCRQRKTACKLGDDVDNPGLPPCNRCRREGKTCTFAPTRKRRTSSAASSQPAAQRPRLGSSEASFHSTGGLATQPAANSLAGYQISTSTGTGNPFVATHSYAPFQQMHPAVQQAQPSFPQMQPGFQQSQPSPFQHMHNPFANPQPSPYAAHINPTYPPYNTPHHSHPMAQPVNTAMRSTVMSGATGGSQVRSDVAARALASDAPTTQDNFDILTDAAAVVAKRDEQSAIDGRLSGSSATDAKEAEKYALSLKAWNSMLFVKSGWFTAAEAMNYIEYFYVHLAPMTPISPPDFRHPSKHVALLIDEPILAVTMLMIASRHMRLSGHGAVTRAVRIHDTLWNFLCRQIQALYLAQEQFGGGSCAAGSVKLQKSQGGQLTWKGSLRTLGTIEALLLPTDWQPRDLHFPPGDNENRLLDIDYNLLSDSNENAVDDQEEADFRQGRPYGAWLEPTWRSDRMSWMLLGIAQALSFELGVFDNNHYDCINDHGLDSSCARKRRVRRMVLVYVSQTSGRLGLTSMLPLPQWSKDKVFEETSRQQSHGQPENAIDIMQSCWVDIARVMYDANQVIFPTRAFTRELIATDEYKEKIDSFRPTLQEWKDKFDSVKSAFHPFMQHVLTMEYEYARCYINSLGLQKVVESWVSLSSEVGDGTNIGHSDHQAKLRDLYEPNREYIEEVADSARIILSSVVDGLAPGGNLRNAPLRTFLRSISGMFFTLKRFGVGAVEGDVRQALDLLDRCTDLMERDVVDDVHVSSQIAGLVKQLVANIRRTFIRVQGRESGSDTASRQDVPQHPASQQQVEYPGDASSQQPARKRQRQSANFRQQRMRDPLEGIQAQPLEDLSNHTFMPPPPNVLPHTGMDSDVQMHPNADPSMFDAMNMDWLTLPLDNLFGSSSGIVDQGFGGIGPTVGDRDMLEVITNEQYDQPFSGSMPNNMQNMNFGYQQ